MILMDFIRLAGFKVKLSIRKPLPLQVAEVLYLSENEQDLEEEDIEYGIDLMEKAKENFTTLEIPIAPRNLSIAYQRSLNENSEESRELDNNHENNINADFSFPQQERFNERYHGGDNFAQRNRQNSQGSHCSPSHFSEPNKLGQENKGKDSFHFVRHIRLKDYKGVGIDTKMTHAIIHEAHRPNKTNLEAKRI